MVNRKLLVGLVLSAALGFLAAYVPGGAARADNKPAAAPAGSPAAKPATTCKAHNGKPCCDPAVTAHLPKEVVFKACGESDATFLGEEGAKETCKYFFKSEGGKEEDSYVQVYSPAQKEVPAQPNDPFFSYKRVGKVYVTDKAKSPKSAPMMAQGTGLYFPGKGYIVTVNASTKVCTKAEATKLAPSIK
jgi:hypothetical protein